MRLITTFLSLALALVAVAQTTERPAVDCLVYPAQETSPYVLPWPVGESYLVWRTTTHWAAGNFGVGLYAFDFAMPIGTKIVAAREGVVVAVEERYQDGNGEDLKENLVFIKHSDGTVARYMHLTHQGVLVSEGERVQQGQVIALSGNTGDSGGPHLHFDVQGCGPNLNPNYNRYPCGQTLPVVFRNTEQNACGLVPERSYTAAAFTPNDPQLLERHERSQIVRAALDYIDGYFTGNAVRMQRALHPELAKRIANVNPNGATTLGNMGAMTLIDQTGYGGGRSIPKENRRNDVTVFDLQGNAASAKINAGDWIDYLHLARFNGRWVIVNVLWERTPRVDSR